MKSELTWRQDLVGRERDPEGVPAGDRGQRRRRRRRRGGNVVVRRRGRGRGGGGADRVALPRVVAHVLGLPPRPARLSLFGTMTILVGLVRERRGPGSIVRFAVNKACQ